MINDHSSFTQALAQLDAPEVQRKALNAEQERAMLLERFPLTSWESMTLEEYALGHRGYEDSLCYLLEFKAPAMGSIRGGSSRKFLIFWSSKADGWWWEQRKYDSADEAWRAVRAGHRLMLELADQGEWAQIDEIEATNGAPATRLKIAYLYFPNKVLPVFSAEHMRHFLRIAGRQDVIDGGAGATMLNQALLAELRSVPELKSRPTHDLMALLYRLAHPREGQEEILRVMPGRGLQWWDDCLQDGFICIGWSAVGNLDEMADREAVKEAVQEAYPDLHATRLGRLTSVSMSSGRSRPVIES